MNQIIDSWEKKLWLYIMYITWCRYYVIQNNRIIRVNLKLKTRQTYRYNLVQKTTPRWYTHFANLAFSSRFSLRHLFIRVYTVLILPIKSRTIATPHLDVILNLLILHNFLWHFKRKFSYIFTKCISINIYASCAENHTSKILY